LFGYTKTWVLFVKIMGDLLGNLLMKTFV